MGTLFSTLDIARSGMQAAQVQLDIAGHNIANVNKQGFSRQRVLLMSRVPNMTPYGAFGRGVTVGNIERVRDSFLDVVYRQQVPGVGNYRVQAQYYRLLEDAFLEPTENGFGTRLDSFFDALQDFANNVESLPVREAVLAEAGALTHALNNMAQRFYELRTNANEEVRNIVSEVNSLAQRIASLNAQVRDFEVGGNAANDLRDDRDVLLDQLAELINITYRERENGQVDVLIAGDVLLQGDQVRALAAVREPALDPERQDLLQVRFADNNRAVTVRNGRLYGVLSARDTAIVEADGRIDALAAAIIRQINSIHTQSNGLVNLSGTLSSTNAVSAATDPLVAAGLPFPVTTGSFDVVVYDAAGVATTTTITITNATTLNDLAAALNGVANFSASVSGNTLTLGTSAPYTFAFANDTSGVLTALGINGLFTGYDARTIALNPDIAANPARLSSAYSLNVLDTGDNAAALAMAAIRSGLHLEGGTESIEDYYESTIARIGVDARASTEYHETQQAFVDNFQRRRQEGSGVSLDEEVTNLITCERAFQASARVITITDRMLEVLLNMAL